MYNITKTIEEKAKEEVTGINNSSESSLMMLAKVIDANRHRFWFGQSPVKEKLKILGTEAQKMFQDHYDTSVFLAQKLPGYIPKGIPANVKLQYNTDGSIELLEEIELEDVAVEEEEI